MFVSKAEHLRQIDELCLLREQLTKERERCDFMTHEAGQSVALIHEELGLERGRREILSQQIAVQTSLVEFLCGRVNHLEAERVLLLRQLTHVDLPTPQVRPKRGPADSAALEDLSIFDDDPRHAPAGWNDDGTVNYGPEPKDGEQS